DIAPGEYILLFGSGLAPDGLTVANTVPFLTSLGNVQIMINGTAAPIYYTTPTTLAVIVPYGTASGIANIQVNNNVNPSKTVSAFVGGTSPGIFTANQNGIRYDKVQHTDWSLVTPSNPAHPGETLFVYLTGLGAVSPAVSDGAAAPSDSLVKT